jgi:hypothetical protein
MQVTNPLLELRSTELLIWSSLFVLPLNDERRNDAIGMILETENSVRHLQYTARGPSIDAITNSVQSTAYIISLLLCT